ncbi:MAG: hypothetical protein IPJ98_30590 [Bryobacterales bacterium]|nr:hypothetical protein [Bryobacterales bacterium]
MEVSTSALEPPRMRRLARMAWASASSLFSSTTLFARATASARRPWRFITSTMRFW